VLVVPTGRAVAVVAVLAAFPLPLLAAFFGPAVSVSGSGTSAVMASPK